MASLAVAVLGACEPTPFENARSDDRRVRKEALDALSDIHGPFAAMREAATDAMIAALDDPDKDVRQWAAFSLRHRNGPKTSAALIAKVASEDQVEIRISALWSVAHLGDRSAIPGLIRAWESGPGNPTGGKVGDNFGLAIAISEILSKPEFAQAAVDPLVAALNHPNWFVRRWAVATLGKIADPTTRDKITPLLKDPHEEVRILASGAIRRLDARKPQHQ